MSDLTIYHTTHAAPSIGGTATHGEYMKLPGLSFIDLILARLTAEGLDSTSIQSSMDANNTPDDVILQNPEQSSDQNNITSDNPTALFTLPSEKQDKIFDILYSFLNGVPAENKDLQTPDASGENKGVPALIATGLSPEKLTDLIQKMSGKRNDNNGNALNVFTNFLKIIAPGAASTEESQTSLNATIAAQELAQNGDITKVEGAKETILNFLTRLLSGQSDTKPAQAPVLPIPQGQKQGLPSGSFTAEAALSDEVPESAEWRLSDGVKTDVTGKISPDIKGNPGAILSAVTNLPAQNTAAANLAALNNDTAWQDIFPEGLDWSSTGLSQGKGMTLNGTGPATSLVGYAPQAALPHPATQMVAVTLIKAAAGGENKALTLKLDPPELGRIEIRMQFGKDKTLKAHMIIEKPETYMMLQRDTHVLERSLQGTGLDIGSDGLSLELSQDGSLFNGDGERGGERFTNGKTDGAEAENDETTIQTTMTWYVDPHTGQQHYNILA